MNDSDVSAEVVARLLAPNKCYFGLQSHLQSRPLLSKTKIMLYKILCIRYFYMALKHGPLQRGEKRLRIFEKRILRSTVWRRKKDSYSSDISVNYSVFKELDMAVTMKGARLRWLGHVMRMGVGAIPEQQLFAEPWAHK
jgi:hypothetical protein